MAYNANDYLQTESTATSTRVVTVEERFKSSCPFPYDLEGNTATITGPAQGLKVVGYDETDGGSLMIKFESTGNYAKPVMFINDPLAADNEKAVRAVLIKLKQVTEACIGRYLDLKPGGADEITFNNFEEMYQAFLSKIDLDADHNLFGLLEFRAEEATDYVNLNFVNAPTKIVSQDASDLDMDFVLKKTCTLTMSEAPATEANSVNMDLV